MADPFQELGITRRPLFQMFGLPEDRGAGSPRMAQAVQNDRITQAAQMKLDQDIADIERRGQAEAAADEFVRQNPDAAMAGSSRYGDIQQYRQMQQRGPSYSDAVLSRSLASKLSPVAREKFYQNIEAGMGANASFDDAEADEEDMKLRVGLVEAGVPRATVEGMQGRIDQLTAAELRAMAKSGGGSSGKNPEMQALEDNYEMLRKEYEDARTLGEVSPELEKDYLDTRGELLKRRRALYTPRQQTPDAAKQIVNNVAAGLTAAGGMASGLTPAGSVAAGIMSGTANAAGVDLRPTGAGGGFMDTMRKAAKPEDILRVDEKEITEGVNDPSADENTFMAAIQDPKVSLPVKQQALARLEDYAKNIKPVPTMKPREHFDRIKRIKESVEEGRKSVEMAPVVAEYNKTWDAEKAEMSSRIARFAEALGLTQEQAEYALREDDALPVRHLVPAPTEGWKRQDTQNPDISARKAFELFVAKDLGGKPGDEVLLNKRPDRFLPFEGSKFAGELGMQGPIPGFRSLGKGKNYAEVLDVYLREKQPTVAGSQAAVPGKPVIKSITPIP
jgi:hypothetical protein